MSAMLPEGTTPTFAAVALLLQQERSRPSYGPSNRLRARQDATIFGAAKTHSQRRKAGPR